MCLINSDACNYNFVVQYMLEGQMKKMLQLEEGTHRSEKKKERKLHRQLKTQHFGEKDIFLFFISIQQELMLYWSPGMGISSSIKKFPCFSKILTNTIKDMYTRRQTIVDDLKFIKYITSNEMKKVKVSE